MEGHEELKVLKGIRTALTAIMVLAGIQAALLILILRLLNGGRL